MTLSPSKNFDEAFCTLGPQTWSPKIVTPVNMADGTETEVFFRCKTIELSDDAEDFRLFLTGLGATSGWSSPPEIAAELNSDLGTLGRGAAMGPYTQGWIDGDTYIEVNEWYSRWLSDAATALMKNHEWDLFFMHSHPPDWVYHAVITAMEENNPDRVKYEEAWRVHLGIYETQDRMIGRILEVLDEDTLVVLVSDHGATADGPMFDPYKALVPAGLTTLGEQVDMEVSGKFAEGLRIGLQLPIPAKSKAMPQRSIYVYVNLKGRDPEGIVDPEDYEKVQQEIIDALYAYVDPKTGQRPIALALSKQDARILGLYGPGIGDVVYAIRPEFGSQHGSILPATEHGVGSLKALFTFTGPGVKKGYRLKRTCWITDMVPTICYLMGLPVPETADGAVIYQIFEDPDFKRKETEELKQKLAELEKKLA